MFTKVRALPDGRVIVYTKGGIKVYTKLSIRKLNKRELIL